MDGKIKMLVSIYQFVPSIITLTYIGTEKFIVPWFPSSYVYPHLHKKIFIFKPIFVKFSCYFMNNI